MRLLEKLGRKTLSTQYLPEIDGLRFIAILAVILFHLSDDLYLRHGVRTSASTHWLVTLFSHGDRGVQLFFVLSGFILAVPFARRALAGGRAPDLPRYFLRRLTRLEPPFLVNVLVCTAATWVVTANLRGHLLPHFLSAITYSHALIYHYNNPINMVWWSLEIETQFYLLMPLLALVFRLRSPWLRRGLLAGVALSSFLWQRPDSSWIITSSILDSVQYFLVGMLIADLVESAPHARTQRSVWDFAGVGALGGLFLAPAWWRTAAPALLFVVILAALRGKAFRRGLSLPWIAATGGMCYTIYLWHLFVMALVLKATSRLLVHSNFAISFALQMVLILPVIFAVSVALYLLVEKPCMATDWPAKILNRVRPRVREERLAVVVAEQR